MEKRDSIQKFSDNGGSRQTVTGLLRRSRVAADVARSARDVSLGVYNALACGVLVRRRGSDIRAERAIRRILVVKLDRLGDVILASAFFRELRKNYPDATITVVTSAESLALLQSCPYVDRTIAAPASLLNIVAARRIARSLQSRFGSPDLAIIPRYCVDLYGAGWISFFSGAPFRVAFSESATPRKSLVNRGADVLFTDLVSPSGVPHEVERNLDLLRHLGLIVSSDKLEIWSSDSERRAADSMLTPAGGEQLIAVGLGASQPKKMWPIERYAEVCRRLRAVTGARLVVMGSRSEIPLLNRFRDLLGDAVVVSGAVSLGTVAALFARCSLFIGCDSAQKHIAAAAGIPVVEVSCHPADGDPANGPARFGAWGVPQAVLQPSAADRPCSAGCEALTAHCILRVSVADVERAAATLLASHVHLVGEGQ